MADEVPWAGIDTKDIIHTMVSKRETLAIAKSIQRPFDSVLHYGLKHLPASRDVSVEQFRDLMNQLNIVSGADGEGVLEFASERRVENAG